MSALFPFFLFLTDWLIKSHQLCHAKGIACDSYHDPNLDPTVTLLGDESPYPGSPICGRQYGRSHDAFIHFSFAAGFLVLFGLSLSVPLGRGVAPLWTRPAFL